MTFIESVVEILTPLVALIVTVASPLAVAALFKLFQKWGIDIEAQHRAALQSALHNAAMIAVSKITKQPVGGAIVTPAAVPVNIAVDYVQKSVPDALGKFGLDQNKIIDMLQPHIAEALIRKNS